MPRRRKNKRPNPFVDDSTSPEDTIQKEEEEKETSNEWDNIEEADFLEADELPIRAAEYPATPYIHKELLNDEQEEREAVQNENRKNHAVFEDNTEFEDEILKEKEETSSDNFESLLNELDELDSSESSEEEQEEAKEAEKEEIAAVVEEEPIEEEAYLGPVVEEKSLSDDEELWSRLKSEDEQEEDIFSDAPEAPSFDAFEDEEDYGDEEKETKSIVDFKDKLKTPSFLQKKDSQELTEIEEATHVASENLEDPSLEEEFEQEKEEQDYYDEQEEEWQPTIHLAARQAIFTGNSALPVVMPTKNDEEDEITHALSAFADLQFGQKGFVRFSMRTWPGFKDQSRSWLQARKMGEDPDAKKKSPVGKIFAWGKYMFSYLWFMANQSSRHLGNTPPQRPGGGEVKPLPSSQVTEEEKAAWKNANIKAQDSTHYEVDLRVATFGAKEDAEELERIAEEAASGLQAFATPHQEFHWGQAGPYDTAIGFMGTREKDMISLGMSATEIGAMAHVPDDLTQPHGIIVKRTHFKQLPLPTPVTVKDPYNPQKGVIPIGRINVGSEDEKVIGMPNAALDKHMYYAGRTGTGKSELMKWLAFGVAKDDYPMVVIDPHGALSEDLFNVFVINNPERLDDIVVCDLSDEEYPVALNPLDVKNRTQVEATVRSVMEMLEKQMQLGSGGAPRAVMFASQAITALCHANLALKDPNTKCTLLHVTTFFTDPDFRRLVVEFCDNESVKETFDPDRGPFEQLSEKQQTEYAMPILRSFAKLGSSESFSAVFSSAENRLDFGKLISDKKIIIVKLARHSHQAELGEFVGALILPWLLSTMDDWGRTRDEETGELKGSGCRVFVDEAPTLFGPNSTVPQVLAEARKWDLGLIFTSQFLDQFDKTIIQATLANTGSKIALGLEMNSARIITTAIAGASSKVTPGDIADLPNYHYYGNIMLPRGGGGAGVSGPFSAACLFPINGKIETEHKQEKEKVKQTSRRLVSNKIEDVNKKRRTAVDDIKEALSIRLRERVESGMDDNDTSFSLDLDQNSDSFSDGWGDWDS